MRVAVFPSDDRGCGWYRLRWPAQQLAAEGHDVVVDPPLGYYRDPTGGETARLYLDADVAVVQRIVSDVGLEFVQALKAHGHKVIVDVDDDLDALHDGHPYREQVDGTHEGQHRDNLHACCDLADLVTCTTRPLAERYAPHGRFAVLPNLVPAKYLAVKARRRGPLRVGWTGRPESHIGDASVMGGRVGPAVAAHGALFAAWGNTAPVTFRQVRAPAGAQVRVPFRPLRSGYPESVAELSVGLVPLLDTPFNVAKSWLKGIEMAALGVPFVASPLPEYRKLVELGAGLLAPSPEAWAGHVEWLLAEPGIRADLAEAGRAAVRGLTYEAHAGRWWDAWTGAGDDTGSSTMITTSDTPTEGMTPCSESLPATSMTLTGS